MRQALRQNRGRGPTARAVPVPAPTGGWNAQDSLAAMPPTDALILDNWIPRAGYVEMRRGFVQQSTGTPSPVESLMVWRGGGANPDKLFCAAGGAIYDASTPASAVVSVYTGLTSDRLQSLNVSTLASRYLLAFNGVDTPVKYDGTSWTANTITGTSGATTLDPKTLIDATLYKGRLYMVKAASLQVWFLAPAAISGACDGLLDLGTVFTKGGAIICCGTWTLDGGNGPDDYLAFMSDQGQVAVYQGTDPTNSTGFSLVGVFSVGRPLSRRALIQYGADLAIVTSDGIVPLSQAARLDRSQDNAVSLTAKIHNAFFDAVRATGSLFGWDALLYAGGGLGVFNVPLAPDMNGKPQAMQFVQNMQTGAWCRFLGLNATCWAEANGQPYFGGSDGVYAWDVGSDDNGALITADVKPAFSSMGAPGRLKQFTMVRPLMKCSPLVQPALEVLTDYRESIPTAVPTILGAGDVNPADVNLIQYAWAGAAAEGYVATPRMRVVLRGDPGIARIAVGDGSDVLVDAGDDVVDRPPLPFEVPVQLIGFDVMMQAGGIL